MRPLACDPHNNNLKNVSQQTYTSGPSIFKLNKWAQFSVIDHYTYVPHKPYAVRSNNWSIILNGCTILRSVVGKN